MIVQQLIEILKTYPADALVVTEGYEDGYESIKKVALIQVEENKDKEWWNGRYNKVNNGGLEVVFWDAETKNN